MTQIYIIDRQTDTVLEDIQADDFWGELRTRDLNGLDIFDFVTFADKVFSQYLKGEKGIIIPSREGGYAEFIIKENKQTETRDRYVFSEGSFIEIAKKKIIEPGTYTGTPQQLINLTMNGIAKWKVGNITYATVRTIQVEERITAYQMLKLIAKAFEYELKFRIDVNKGKIARFVDLVEKIGSYRGHEIELGHNLAGIERHENTRDIVTALNVFGPPDENGNRKHVFVFDDEAKARWSTDGEHLVEDYYPETLDQDITIERLTILGENELAKRVNAIVTYRVKMVDLEKEIGEDVHFGDEVRSKDEGFVPPLYLEGRIHTMREDLKGIIPTDVDFGDFVELSVEEAFSNFRKLQEEMAKKVSEAQLEEYAEKKIPEQATAPDPNEYPKWVDTSKNPPQLMLWDGEKWTTVKGEPGKDGKDGKDGYTPIKGVDYFDGIDGQDGADGSSSYLWVRYSQNANGNPMTTDPTNAKYIGVATTTTPSAPTSYTGFNWSLVKGSDGIPGEDGSDGRTSYLHIKYSNDGGATFTANGGEAVGEWIGTYVDFNEGDSTLTSRYTWNKVKGERGEKGETGNQGIQGPPGTDGKSLYTWVKYADNASGGGMSDSPTNKKYMGIAINKATVTESNVASDYTWAKIEGDQGIPGAPGTDGKTTYTWTKYADDENGSGMSDSPTGKRYLGLAWNKTTQTESNTASDYTWSPLYDNVKVGGRNLLRNSTWNLDIDNWEGSWSGNTYQILPPEADKPTSHILQIISASTTSQKYNVPFPVELGKEYTVSVDIKVEKLSGTNTNLFAIRTFSSPDLANSQANSTSTWYPFKQGMMTKANEWQRFSFTFVADDKWLRVMPYNSEVGDKAFFREIMVDGSNIEVGWTPALEDVDAEIEKAKQDAKNAQTSADGKNTVFYQTSEPSKTGRKANDIWFDTDNGFKMHRFDGSNWVEAQFDYQALNVKTLSAIAADLGTVTAGRLEGIEIIGGTIKSNTSIDVTTDLFVGNNIYLGKSNLIGRKSIDFFNGQSYISSEYITVDGFERNRIAITAAGNRGIVAIAGSDIQLIGTNVISFTGQSSTASIDITGGDLRMRQSPERYVTISKDGRVYAYNQNGLLFNIFEADSLNHKVLRMGSVMLKFLNSTFAQVQVRNTADSAYASIAASEFAVNSTRDSKENIHPYTRSVWEDIKSLGVYTFTRKAEEYPELEQRYYLGHMQDEVPSPVRRPEGYDVSGMLTMHTKALQEIMARIELLEGVNSSGSTN